MRELLYAIPGGRPGQGLEWGLTPAHMSYRVGPGPRLVGVGLSPGGPRRSHDGSPAPETPGAETAACAAARWRRNAAAVDLTGWYAILKGRPWAPWSSWPGP